MRLIVKRRIKPRNDNDDFYFGIEYSEISRGSNIVHLTRTQWRILLLMAARLNRPTDFEMLMDIYDPGYTGKNRNGLTVAICHLRDILPHFGLRLHTWYTVGYYLVQEGSDEDRRLSLCEDQRRRKWSGGVPKARRKPKSPSRPQTHPHYRGGMPLVAG